MGEVRLSASAAARIIKIAALEKAEGLRVAVNGGGCSGFQYDISLAAAAEPDDIVIERDGAKLFVDPVSLPLLSGSEVDWAEELIGSAFKIKNPNARTSCGCGVSFSV
jgi:iron-sulfur cluster assembly accessory protein